MEKYSSFDEFKERYEKDMEYGIFFETHDFLHFYRKPKNLKELILKDKRYDRCESYITLNRVLEIRCLCMMIEEVDLKYRCPENKKEYFVRTSYRNLYHY